MNRELLIRFFHRIYVFYNWKDLEYAQMVYKTIKNYDEFDQKLFDRGIMFTYDF